MKEMLKRALRTFIQSSLGYIATNIILVLSDVSSLDMLRTVLTGLITSASAAGLAAVMNMPKKECDCECADTSSGADESGIDRDFSEGDEENER